MSSNNKDGDWGRLVRDAARLFLREVAKGTGKEFVDSVRRSLKERREKKKDKERDEDDKNE